MSETEKCRCGKTLNERGYCPDEPQPDPTERQEVEGRPVVFPPVEGRTVHNVPDPMGGEALGVWCSAEWWGNAMSVIPEARRLAAENAELRAVNESVAVCPAHTDDIVGDEPACWVCEAAELRERVEALEAGLEEAAYALGSAARMLMAINETDPTRDRREMAERTSARAVAARRVLNPKERDGE